MTEQPQYFSRFIVPPGVAVRKRHAQNNVEVQCSCSLNLAALFPDGPPSPPLPLSRCELHELLLELPENLRNAPWRVCFDTEHDGFSLHNFYRMMGQVHNGAESAIGLFIATEKASYSRRFTPTKKTIETEENCECDEAPNSTVVFGCFAPEVPCLEHSQHAFFGSEDTFVFTYADVSSYAGDTNNNYNNNKEGPVCGGVSPSAALGDNETVLNTNVFPSPRPMSSSPSSLPRILSVYRWVMDDDNKEFVVCANDFFGIGGGRDGAAIFVDSCLLNGTSSVCCGTFASPSLIGRARASLRHSEFVIARMVWLAAKERRGDYTSMDLATREPCDCGRLLRGAAAVGRRGWHICSDERQFYLPFS